MKIRLTIVVMFFSIALNYAPFADDTNADPVQEYGWLINEKRSPDWYNVKSENGFGVQMWIINDKSFFEDWNKPEPPNLEITQTAIKNEPVFIIFLFINPGLDEASKADVLADVIIKDPDGKVYGEFTDMEIWKGVYDAPRNSIQLGVGYLGLVIEGDEPLGVYKNRSGSKRPN